MLTSEQKNQIEQNIITVLKNVYDPEIPVNIYDLGLIYEIRIDDIGFVNLKMTLTAPNCPVAESLPIEVKEKTTDVKGVSDVNVEVVFDPPWSRDMISEYGLLELGLL